MIMGKLTIVTAATSRVQSRHSSKRTLDAQQLGNQLSSIHQSACLVDIIFLVQSFECL